MQIMQGDVTFILQDEIPDLTIPFIDDVGVKGPPSHYELPDGTYETSENPSIRRFVWEHFQGLNRVIHRIGKAGGTFNGKKSFFCIPDVLVVGHRCNIDGRVLRSVRTPYSFLSPHVYFLISDSF